MTCMLRQRPKRFGEAQNVVEALCGWLFGDLSLQLCSGGLGGSGGGSVGGEAVSSANRVRM